MARESAEPKARILIVEDEFLIALELKDEAERLGYQVTGTAATGERALALAEETRPNLVLMDILLKGEMDGIEAAEAIRDRWGIPVIFLTAYAEADRLKSARLVYPFGYLIKPVKERDLEITIEMALYLVQADAVRKEAEKALRQSEVRYRQIFNNMSNGVAIYRAVDDGEDFVFIDINPAGARSGNMPRQDHIGRSVRQVYPGVRDLGLFDVFQRVHRTGLDEFHPLSLYQDDAITLWVENYVCRLPSGDIMAVYSDLTESKRAESALRSSEERYRHLFENAPVGLFQSRLSDGKIMACNSFFARQTGYDTPEACCDDYVAAEHCVDPAARDRVVSELVRQGKVIDREIEVTRKDGTPVWTRFSAKVYPEEGLVVGAVIDITESKRAAEALVESEEKFRVISEQSLLGMAIVQDEVVRYANQAYAAISEYSVEEILSWKPGESAKTIHPDDRDFVLAQALKKQQGEPGAVTNYVYRGVTRSGKVKWIEIFSRTILFNHRPADLMTFIDISERKQAEEALRDSQEKYRLLIETAADAIFIAQKDVIKFPNAKALELTGYTEAELASIPFTEIIHPDDRDLVLARHRSRLRGDSPPPTYEFRIRHKTGHVVPVQLNTAVTQWEGQPATLNVVRDVTEQKRLEQQLQQAHKMEAIGTLAGGIAHDFNNILAGIIGYTELAGMVLPKDSPARNHLNEVVKAGHRARVLIRQILDFSRRGESERHPVELSLILKEVMKLLRPTLPATIEIRQDLDPVPLIVEGDPTQLHQVLMNLCANSAHAMRQTGGILGIRLSAVNLDDPSVSGVPDLSSGRYCVMSIQDTGHGMSSETMDRIFEPFYTTKGTGEGTGMGLAVVFGIVKSHGGAITVQSELGQGTTFDVFLPLIDSGGPGAAKDDDIPISTGDESILFVDDEPVLSELGKKLLEQLGYQVTSMTSSRAALELFRSRPNDFDLVITDYTMPQLTGVDLAVRMLEIRPDIPVILCTGFSHQITAEAALKTGIRRFLMKPLGLEETAEAIRSILDEKRK